MEEAIVNKVSESGLLMIDPADLAPAGETLVFDLRGFLFMELILKEKDFREALKNTDWEVYRAKNVAVICSADAIIPVWAYMLVATWLQPVAASLLVGSADELERQLFLQNIRLMDLRPYQDQRVVIKGCGDIPIGDFVYMELTRVLRPIVKSIMYGEPCSTVPVFKRSPQKPL